MKYNTENIAEALYKQRVDEASDWSGFKVRYTYAGDSLSDYESTCIVKAKDEKEAVKIAKKRVKADGARNFRIDGIIGSYKQYKKDFPHSGFEVFEDVNVVEEGKSYDFSNDADKENACAEYSKCMLNNLSSSAEKRMYELDNLAHNNGLKFVMTNYKQWSLPHAVVKPKYELVEEGTYDGVPTVAVPHEFSSQDWMNKKVKERIKIYLDYFEDAKKSGRKMKRNEISNNFNKLEKICLGIKDMDDYSKANQLLNIADTNGFVYKKYIDKLVNDLRTGKKFNLKGTPEVVEGVDEDFDVTSVCEAGKYANIKVPNSDIKKMAGYFAKGSNPKALANTVKNIDKALSRYYISVATGWKECEETFYQRCLDLGVSEDDLKEVKDKASKDTSIDIGQGNKTTTNTKKEDNTSTTPTRKTINAKNDKPKGPRGVPFECKVIEAFINEYSDDQIPYYTLDKIIGDNYDAVVTTNEYNWVQQGKFNVSSNEPIDLTNLNYLIQKAGYTTKLVELKKPVSKGGSTRYQFRRG